jgi:hypothetical protein
MQGRIRVFTPHWESQSGYNSVLGISTYREIKQWGCRYSRIQCCYERSDSRTGLIDDTTYLYEGEERQRSKKQQ